MEGCSCSLGLGLHGFPHSIPEEMEPLQKRFYEQKFTFANPLSKVEEKLPLMETLAARTEENYFSQGSQKFKMFPPAILIDNKTAPGFPSTFKDDAPGEKQDWLTLYGEKFSEEVISQNFISHFTKHPEEGFMLHPYCSETYLWPLKKKAEAQRKTEADLQKCDPTTLPLSTLELDICDCLGISIRSILESSEVSLDNSKLEAYVLKLTNVAQSNKKQISSSFSWAKKKLIDNGKVKNHITYKFYLAEVQARNFETDLMISIKDKKAIINVEIKSTPDSPEKSLKNTLKKAANQLKIVNKTFISSHQDILTEGWNFVRVIAVPNIGDMQQKLKAENEEAICCNHCKEFVRDESAMKNIDRWMFNLQKKIIKSNSPDHKAYERFFARLVGFTSISNSLGKSVTFSLQDIRSEYERAIVGTKMGVSSEQTLNGETLTDDLDDPQKLCLKNLKGGKHLSSLEVMCYWNPLQVSVLMKRPKRVLFDADFGCGKTLLKKHFACCVAKESAQKVFFISLAAAKGQEVDELTWRRPAVIDVAHAIDFAETGVEVIGVKDIIPTDLVKSDLNDHLLNFMKKHPNDHFFIDELPVNGKLKKGVPPFQPLDLSYLQECESSSIVWVTLRPSEIEGSKFETYVKDLTIYKEKMKSEGFLIPHLTHNMRNASSVVKAMDSLYTAGKECKNVNFKTQEIETNKGFKHKEILKFTVSKAPLPVNTVPGNMPIIIPIMSSMCGSDVVKYAIEEYFKDPNEPVVVLVIKKREFSKVVTNCETFKGTRNICVYHTRGEIFNEDQENDLREFLSNPAGILITDADAFAGMQARNIIVVGDTSRAVRNYVMRTISFIIFIQDKGLIDNLINKNINVNVDKKFLVEKLQDDSLVSLKATGTDVWIWHLPYGTTEEDIKEHVLKEAPSCELQGFEKLTHEDVHIGYRLTVSEEDYKMMVDPSNKFWPPGWSGRRYKDQNLNFKGKSSRNQSNMAPQEIEVFFSSENTTEDYVSNYVKSSGIQVIGVQKKVKTGKKGNNSEPNKFISFIVMVPRADYKTVINPDFWKGANGWQVRIVSKNK